MNSVLHCMAIWHMHVYNELIHSWSISIVASGRCAKVKRSLLRNSSLHKFASYPCSSPHKRERSLGTRLYISNTEARNVTIFKHFHLWSSLSTFKFYDFWYAGNWDWHSLLDNTFSIDLGWTSLEPRLSIRDFVLQLWRKIGKESLGSRLRMDMVSCTTISYR